jgi:hypothetical protein
MPAASRRSPPAPAAPVNPAAPPVNPVAAPVDPDSLFQINLNLRMGGHLMLLAQLLRGASPLVMDRRGIVVFATLMIWAARDNRAGTGHGVCFFHVQHHPNVRVTSLDVTGWLLATFPTMRPEQVQVLQRMPHEIRAENVFYQVLTNVPESLNQT